MTNKLSRYSSDTTYGLSSYSSGGGALANFGSNFTQALSMTNLHEQGRALLASTALENVGALSSMESYLCQVAPSGAHRYKAIADAYTAAVIGTIMDW
jgi:hypothetical protein